MTLINSPIFVSVMQTLSTVEAGLPYAKRIQGNIFNAIADMVNYPVGIYWANEDLNDGNSSITTQILGSPLTILYTIHKANNWYMGITAYASSKIIHSRPFNKDNNYLDFYVYDVTNNTTTTVRINKATS